MKIVLKIVLAITIGFVAFGYYTNYQNTGEGEKFIGIGVLIFAFILMPLFVYHRYKNKDLSKYAFRNSMQNKEPKEENKI